MFFVLLSLCRLHMAAVHAPSSTRAILPTSFTQHIHEYHVDIPWFSVPSLGFCHGSAIAKKEAYDALVYVYVV
jgi:hypothetical protein